MTLGMIFAALAAFAVVLVLWRLKFPTPREQAPDDDLAANCVLFKEKIRQLQDQFDAGDISWEQAHDLELEYQRQFLADNASQDGAQARRGGTWIVLGCALLIPVVATALYFSLGASQELKLRQQLEARSELFTSGKGDLPAFKAATDEVIASMTELSLKYPDKPVYPVLLARLYADEGSFNKAIPYYLKATALLPEDGLILAEYAQILFLAAGNEMSEQIQQLAQSALQLTPQNQTALGLAGIASFQDGEYQRAIDYWTHAIALLPQDSPSGEALRTGIESARERLAKRPDQEQPAPGVVLKVKVSLGPEVKVPEDATVFVYARTWQGSPMPLAISRLRVADLPVEVELTEAMAMAPTMSLTSVDKVEVVARVSLSGAPTAAPGDFEATAGPIEARTQQTPIDLPITTVIAE